MKPARETWIFTALLLLANLSLFVGKASVPLVFIPENVARGEWWRLITFPFVHVSWYHLIMDGVAFLFLYNGLQEKRVLNRLYYVCACAMGSLGLSLLISPMTNGLCGLSGVAHGLMAITGLELLQSKDLFLKRGGITALVLVIGKSVIELLTGNAFFSALHIGNVGNPVVACHLGGILGGISMYLYSTGRLSTRCKLLVKRVWNPASQ